MLLELCYSSNFMSLFYEFLICQIRLYHWVWNTEQSQFRLLPNLIWTSESKRVKRSFCTFYGSLHPETSFCKLDSTVESGMVEIIRFHYLFTKFGVRLTVFQFRGILVILKVTTGLLFFWTPSHKTDLTIGLRMAEIVKIH